MHICVLILSFSIKYSIYIVYVQIVFKCRITEQDLSRCRESAKAEKSEIEVLFFQYQSELNNLIKTEKRLREMYAYTYYIA